MARYICDSEFCTACGACVEICPKKCIVLEETIFGGKKAKVDNLKCVDCKLCGKVCHINNDCQLFSTNEVFAAWSTNDINRENAASGGIASELYKYAINNSIFTMGTYLDRKSGVSYEVVNKEEDIQWANNSKYVFSTSTMIFNQYYKKLVGGEIGIFIGLPCQVAALKTFLSVKKCPMDNLYTVDIICHGVPPYNYLSQHLSYIENKLNNKIKKVSFRYKSDYLIRCYDEGNNLIYKKDMLEDVYFLSFMGGLSYRDNCYKCKYAQEKRTSDVTLGDYSGLGRLEKWDKERLMVSLILCHTAKGSDLIRKLYYNKQISMYARPIQEPFIDKVGNPQLHHPSIPHRFRNDFAASMKENNDFEINARKYLKKELYRYYIKKPYIVLKRFAVDKLTDNQKRLIKKALHINNSGYHLI